MPIQLAGSFALIRVQDVGTRKVRTCLPPSHHIWIGRLYLQELNEAVKAVAEAVATLPWALTDNFMEMRQGRAVLQLSGPGSSLAGGMGSSYLREAVKKVPPLSAAMQQQPAKDGAARPILLAKRCMRLCVGLLQRHGVQLPAQRRREGIPCVCNHALVGCMSQSADTLGHAAY